MPIFARIRNSFPFRKASAVLLENAPTAELTAEKPRVEVAERVEFPPIIHRMVRVEMHPNRRHRNNRREALMFENDFYATFH